MQVNDPQYQAHPVFDELERHIGFYEHLARSVFQWASSGTSVFGNIDSYVYSSIHGTLSSIQTVLRSGRINDAYSLLRKYHDSVVINVYSILYLEENFSINNFVVEQIDRWLKGTAQLPEYRVMSQYIRACPRVASITAVLYFDDRYKRLRDRCNDHTHYNFYRNVLLNDNEIHLPHRGQALDAFVTDLRDLVVLHFAYLFFARQHYMMASDYVDCLECGYTPEADSQYWVAPFVQEGFDEILAKHRPDVAAIIRCGTSMHLA
ncbi:MAG: hypothetical protein QM811_03780 [Pirellulales bacterium]